MKELKEAQMGIITVLALMLVSIKRRLPTRRFSSGITTLALAGIVLLVAAGGASAANCGAGTGNPCQCGDTVMGDWTFTGDLDCSSTPGNGLIIGADGITIDGDGYAIIGDRTSCPNCGEANPEAGYTGILNYNATLPGGHDDVVIKDLEIKNFCNGIVIKGFGAEAFDTPADNNTIFECSVHDNGDDATGKVTHGIHLWRATNTTVKDCAVYNNTGFYIAGCGTGGHGIRLYGNSDNCTVEGCNIYNNTISGIFTKYQCDNCTIAYNKVTDNGVAGKKFTGGIRLMCMASNDWLVEKNNVTDITGPGIFVRGSNCLVRHNTVTGSVNATGAGGCRGNGIFIHGDASGTEIYNNTFCDNEFKDIHDTGTGTVGDSNTCDKSNIAGACDWSCNNPVSVYFDFDGDGQHSKKWEDCPCALPGGAKCACCNPGLFNGSADAKTSYEATCDCQWTPGPDPNDCNLSIMGIVKPDLVVANKSETWFNETHYYVSYRVQNIGNDTSNESVACVYINTVHQTGSDETILELAPNAYSDKTVGPFGPCGSPSDTIKVCADCDNNNTEWNETNNCTENEWAANQPDLIIVNKSETWFDQGADIYNITYCVQNIGTASAAGSRTRVKIDGSATGIPGVVPILAPGEVFCETLPYGITMSGAFDVIELCADGPGWFTESNETNNCLENTFSSAPKISVVPPSTCVDGVFCVNINVTPNGNYIYGVQYKLTYNKDVIRLQMQNKAPFLEQDENATMVTNNVIDNINGVATYAITRKGTTDGITDPEGTFVVLTFATVGSAGETSILNLSEIVISDPEALPIDSPVLVNDSVEICAANQAPIAVAKSDHKYNNVGSMYVCSATLNGSESHDPDLGDSIADWAWAFDDGQFGVGEIVDHVYSSYQWTGSAYTPFTATLAVTDTGGLSGYGDCIVNVSIAGDANYDGTVNVLDASMTGLRWNKECIHYTGVCWGDEVMADKADLNNDCVVNVLDTSIVGLCWGNNA